MTPSAFLLSLAGISLAALVFYVVCDIAEFYWSLGPDDDDEDDCEDDDGGLS